MTIAEKAVKKKAEETKNEGLRKNKIIHGWFDSLMKQQPFLSLCKKMREWSATSAALIIILTY